MRVVLAIVLSLVIKDSYQADSYVQYKELDENFKEPGSGGLLTVEYCTGKIRKGFFKLCDRLNIDSSNITEIEPGALCTSPDLFALHILRNPVFPNIDHNVLKDCHQVRLLYIANQTVDNGAFIDTPNVTYLELITIKFPDGILSESTLKGLNSLETVRFTTTDFESIDNFAFKSLKNLKKLHFASYNNIKKYAPDAFSGLDSLESLYFGLMTLELKSITWQTMPNLKELFLHCDYNIEGFDFLGFIKKLGEYFPKLEDLHLNKDVLTAGIVEQVEAEIKKTSIKLKWKSIHDPPQVYY